MVFHREHYLVRYYYINDLLLLKCKVQNMCFADDTTLIIYDRDKLNLIPKTTKLKSVIKKWFNKKNFSKTTCIPFSISKAYMFNVYKSIKIHDSNCLG